MKAPAAPPVPELAPRPATGPFAGRPPERVAVILLSAIGDVVHGMPVVSSLRRAWPESRIEWVIQPASHPLVAPHPAVDDFLLFHRTRGWRAFRDFRRATAGRRYDLVIALQVYLKAGLLVWMLPSPVKLGFDRARARDLNWLFTTHRIPARPPAHVQDQYFEFLDWLGVPVVRMWEFAFTEEERAASRAFFEGLDRPALAVVLKTTRSEKEWIIERYARVLEIAESELGLRPVIVGSASPAETAAADALRRETRARVVDARANGLRRLAGLLEGSALLLSPDTGPLHIAVALGTPTVGLYGTTDPKRVGPYRRYEELTVDRYSRPGETEPSPEFRPGNMRRITVEEVAAKLEIAVRRYVRPGTDRRQDGSEERRWRRE